MLQLKLEIGCETCGSSLVKRDGRSWRMKYCSEACKRSSPARKSYLKRWGETEYQKRYRETNRTRLSRQKQDRAREARAEGIAHYGGKCICCGEARNEFLTMEHKNGRNADKPRYTGVKAWLKAKWDGWPEDITLMCFNCNCARGAYGYCPHEKERRC
jgi:hypothetical protein